MDEPRPCPGVGLQVRREGNWNEWKRGTKVKAKSKKEMDMEVIRAANCAGSRAKGPPPRIRNDRHNSTITGTCSHNSHNGRSAAATIPTANGVHVGLHPARTGNEVRAAIGALQGPSWPSCRGRAHFIGSPIIKRGTSSQWHQTSTVFLGPDLRLFYLGCLLGSLSLTPWAWNRYM